MELKTPTKEWNYEWKFPENESLEGFHIIRRQNTIAPTASGTPESLHNLYELIQNPKMYQRVKDADLIAKYHGANVEYIHQSNEPDSFLYMNFLNTIEYEIGQDHFHIGTIEQPEISKLIEKLQKAENAHEEDQIARNLREHRHFLETALLNDVNLTLY